MEKQLPTFVSLYDLGRHTELWMEWLATEAKAGRIPVIMQGDKMMFDSAAVVQTLKQPPCATAPDIAPGTASYLMAAAPDLLAACKLALADRFGGDDECVDGDPVTIALRAAIATATPR